GFGRVVGEIADAMRARACVPVFGAGISRSNPSCMPLGGDLEADLREALWASVVEFERQCPVPTAARESALRIIGAARLERMLDVLQQTHGPEPIREFLSVLRGDRWNRNHAAIA